MRAIEKEVATLRLGPYHDDYLDLRASVEAETRKADEKQRELLQFHDDEDEEGDVRDRQRRQEQEHLGLVRSRLMLQRLSELLDIREGLLGVTVYQALSTLFKHLALAAQDRAALRKAVMKSIAQLVQLLPSCLGALCRFIARMSAVAKPGTRLQAVELTHSLLLGTGLFLDQAEDADDDEADEELDDDLDESYGLVGDDDAAAVPATLSAETLADAARQLLAVLLARTSDKAAGVRARSLSALSECVGRCMSAPNPLVRAELHKILAGVDEAPAAADRAAVNRGSVFSPMVSRIAAGRSSHPALGALQDAPAAPAAAPAAGAQVKAEPGAEEQQQAHAAADAGAEVPVVPFDPSLGGARHLMRILRVRAADARPNVRKAALQTMEFLLISLARHQQLPPGANTVLDTVAPEDLAVLYDAGRDKATMIRKQAVQCLNALYHEYPADPRVCDMWLGAVLPLCSDVETAVQDKAIASIRELAFKPLIDMARGSRASNALRGSEREHPILAAFDRCDSEMLHYAHKCVAALLRRVDHPEPVVELVSLVNSAMDASRGKLLWVIAEEVSLAFPHHLRGDVVMRAFVQAGAALKTQTTLSLSTARTLVREHGDLLPGMMDYPSTSVLRNYDGGAGIHGCYPPPAESAAQPAKEESSGDSVAHVLDLDAVAEDGDAPAVDNTVCAFGCSVYRVLTNLCLAHTLNIKTDLMQYGLSRDGGRSRPVALTTPAGAAVSAAVQEQVDAFVYSADNPYPVADARTFVAPVTHAALVYIIASLAPSLYLLDPRRALDLPLLHAKIQLLQAATTGLSAAHQLPAAACAGACLTTQWERDILEYAALALHRHTTAQQSLDEALVVHALFCAGEAVMLTERAHMTGRLITAVQALLPPTLTAVLDEDAPRGGSVASSLIPPKVRAHAFISIGKAMLRDSGLCKRLAPILVQELVPAAVQKRVAGEMPTPLRGPGVGESHNVLRNNVLLLLCDMCRVFTSVVDPYLGEISASLRDPDVGVRRHALMAISQLLQEDFIKWKGSLFLRMLRQVVDRDQSVRQMADGALQALVQHTMTQTEQHKVEQHFVESFFFFNACTAHAAYNQFRGISLDDADDALLSKANMQVLASKVTHSSAGSEHDSMFVLTGSSNKATRMTLYRYQLSLLSEDQKLRVSARLASDILGGIADGTLPVVAASIEPEEERKFQGLGSSTLTDKIVSLIVRRRHERRAEGDDSMQLQQVRVLSAEEQARVRAVVDDALDILCCSDIQLRAAGDEDEADREEEALAALKNAKSRILSKIQRKNLIENVLPLAVEAKRVLERAHHPLLQRVLAYLCQLVRDRKQDVDEVLASDPRLRDELMYDIRIFEEQDQARRDAARRAQGRPLPIMPVAGADDPLQALPQPNVPASASRSPASARRGRPSIVQNMYEDEEEEEPVQAPAPAPVAASPARATPPRSASKSSSLPAVKEEPRSAKRSTRSAVKEEPVSDAEATTSEDEEPAPRASPPKRGRGAAQEPTRASKRRR
jgi:hypothetical protein